MLWVSMLLLLLKMNASVVVNLPISIHAVQMYVGFPKRTQRAESICVEWSTNDAGDHTTGTPADSKTGKWLMMGEWFAVNCFTLSRDH